MKLSNIRVFLSSELQEAQINHEPTRALIAEFKQYKMSGDSGQLFGRDAPLDRPKEAREEELKHVHVLGASQFKLERLHLKRQFSRTSDAFLVYCRGIANSNAFLLLTIFWQDAHSRSESIDIMKALAKDAEKFRVRF